ncbi:MAG: A/G-specific adenine glycosylase [Opitutae bacterium]|nr:A/G-specific adenine glycosylase [Opitutae bacterium]
MGLHRLGWLWGVQTAGKPVAAVGVTHKKLLTLAENQAARAAFLRPFSLRLRHLCAANSRVPKTSAHSLPAAAVEFQRALLAWYRAQRRELPWREAPSLYKTVVSEFMLQQTQVKTVLPYFARWMEALPDFAALAAAPEARVLKLWEGLGYYSRARNLRRVAQIVAALPEPPRTPEAWRELPGIGPYTAAAITSIAFGAPAAVVDGNVVRILARLTADATEFRDSATAAKAFAPLADALLNRAAPGDHNQAMMELGATVCVRQSPLCLTCPVAVWCAARRTGSPEDFPRLAAKVIEQRAVIRVWCVRAGRLLLHRAADGARRLAQLHELPTAAHLGLSEAAAARGELLLKKKRGITRYQITESIHAAPPPRGALAAGLVWVPLAEIDTLTLSGPHRRWVAAILHQRV